MSILSRNWRKTKIGDLLIKSNDIITPISSETYILVTVRLYGKGVIPRCTTTGAEIKSNRMCRVREGQFILSRIDARNGAFGIIPPELNGALVSGDFPVFDINQKVLEPSYLNWTAKTADFVNMCRQASKGTTNRVRLQEDLFSDMEISLPPLSEQCRIVSKIEKLIKDFTEAKHLVAQREKELDALIFTFYAQIIQNVEWKPLKEVATMVRRKIETKPDGEYAEMGIRSFGKGTFPKPILTGTQIGNKRIYSIHKNDLVFSNVFAWEGAIAVAKEEDHGCVGSHRFITYVPKEAEATSEFLCYHFLGKKGLEDIGVASPGSAGRNRTLGLTKLQEILVPVPRLEKQEKFGEILRHRYEIKKDASVIEKTTSTCEALVVEKAFRGEL